MAMTVNSIADASTKEVQYA